MGKRDRISFWPDLEESFSEWASRCGSDPNVLRRATIAALRTRRGEAFIEHECHRANGRQPDVLTLSLGLNDVHVYFTVEPGGIVVRGYWWAEPIRNSDEDCGGFYCDNAWYEGAGRDILAGLARTFHLTTREETDETESDIS